ncbi:hypothetical protein H6784_05150 [Candidatus Nomurabacteria bacterium]|nr:hypothetical protein [Candidatus Kaiserbacteria bacterium]MCB9814770.1 hypothetical protein [Candidatus Nomurabacteria bacterium]
MIVVEKILANDVISLDIKKLSDQKDIFRVGIGDIGIIFLKANDDIEILEISRRSEKTQKNTSFPSIILK